MLARYGELNDPRPAALVLAATYFKARCLKELDRLEEAIGTCDTLVERYGADPAPAVGGRVAEAMWLKALCLEQAGRSDEERAALSELIARFRDSAEPRARFATARAMHNQAIYLSELGRGSDAIALWDELDARFGADPPPKAPFIAIDAQIAKAASLGRGAVRQTDEAVTACDVLIARCERLDIPGAAEKLAEVMALKRDCLAIAGRAEEVLRADDALLARFADAPAISQLSC